MNQILSLSHKGISKEQLDRVIKFFSFFIIIFAVIFVIEGILGLKENGVIFSENDKQTNKAHIATPDINIKRNGSITILNISSTIGVQKVIYAWNNGIETTIEKSGENEFQEQLDTTIGTNDLNLKIIDSDGNTITYDPVKIAYEEGEETNENWKEAVERDTIKPVISLSSSKGKVIINVTDETKMSYIVYKWNDGEETKVTGLSEDEKSLTTEISPLRGLNELNIKAYDKAGNFEEITKKVQSTDESQDEGQATDGEAPKIDVKKYGNQIVIKVTSETNIKKVEYNFNGNSKTIDNINNTEYELKLDLIDGQNYIIMSAYDINDLKGEYKGKTEK